MVDAEFGYKERRWAAMVVILALSFIAFGWNPFGIFDATFGSFSLKAVIGMLGLVIMFALYKNYLT